MIKEINKIKHYCGVNCPCGCGRRVSKVEADNLRKTNTSHTTNYLQEQFKLNEGR